MLPTTLVRGSMTPAMHNSSRQMALCTSKIHMKVIASYQSTWEVAQFNIRHLHHHLLHHLHHHLLHHRLLHHQQQLLHHQLTPSPPPPTPAPPGPTQGTVQMTSISPAECDAPSSCPYECAQSYTVDTQSGGITAYLEPKYTSDCYCLSGTCLPVHSPVGLA